MSPEQRATAKDLAALVIKGDSIAVATKFIAPLAEAFVAQEAQIDEMSRTLGVSFLRGTCFGLLLEAVSVLIGIAAWRWL